jgi:PKD domain
VNKPLAALAGSLALLLPAIASAHTVNQPPFVYVDGVASGYYAVTYSSLPDFGLPQDSMPQTMTVGQSLNFKINTDNLPILPEELQYLTFTWDMADGTSAKGISFTHTYAKPGPYIVRLTSSDSRTPSDQPQLLDTVLLNILPNASYKLPTPYLEVNGEHSGDVVNDILKASFARAVTLDASRSSQGTSPIASYRWDLGDQSLSNDKTVTHVYNAQLSTVVPVLRVTDTIGFYADSTAQVQNGQFDPVAAAKPTSTATPSRTKQTAGVIGGLIVVLLASALFLRNRTLSGGAAKPRVPRQPKPRRPRS